MNQHTPAPWLSKAAELNNCIHYVYAIDKLGLSYTFATMIHHDPVVATANARLVAAAPMMLDELRIAWEHLRIAGATIDKLARIEAVISAATGA